MSRDNDGNRYFALLFQKVRSSRNQIFFGKISVIIVFVVNFTMYMFLEFVIWRIKRLLLKKLRNYAKGLRRSAGYVRFYQQNRSYRSTDGLAAILYKTGKSYHLSNTFKRNKALMITLMIATFRSNLANFGKNWIINKNIY